MMVSKKPHEKLIEAELEREKIVEKPEFLVETIKEVQKSVAEETDTIAAITLIATTRLLKNAKAESKNLFLSDKTGVGKDYAISNTLKVILPESQHLHITKMSNEAFTYWHNGIIEPDWNWDNKVIHFEDITQALLNCSTFKVMSSGGSSAVVVKDQRTIEIPINGKPAMMITSHHANPEDEALRRFPIGMLDDTTKQTDAIKQKIAEQYSGNKQIQKDLVLRKMLHQLTPQKVIIPYAKLLPKIFPSSTMMRTHFPRFLDYICASAVFHQHQRETTPDGELIANGDDYMLGRFLLIYTSSNIKMIPLSKEYRDVIQIISDSDAPISVNQIFLHPKFTHGKAWLYRHLPRLIATEIIQKTQRQSKDANKDIDCYHAEIISARLIPHWEDLHKVDEKTEKTEKTKTTPTEVNGIPIWFSHGVIKPDKTTLELNPKDLVFSRVIIPPNREVFSVFSVFSLYLRERGEKRYKKYYEKPESNRVEQTKIPVATKPKSLNNKIKEFKDYIEKVESKGRNPSKTILEKHFGNLVFECEQNGLIQKIPGKEQYTWVN